MKTGIKRIIAFPKAGNIYTEQLYKEVERKGVEVIEGVWTRRWLLDHVGKNDVVHIHWPSFLYFEPSSRLRTYIRLGKLAANLALARRLGATIVWTAHNLYPHEGGRAVLSHRWGRRITLHFTDQVIVHGSSAAALVAREFAIPGPRLRVGHHPHWIDCYANSVTAQKSRARLNIGADEFLYLHIGRCKPYKGLEALIDAFRRVPAPARLLIAGKFSSPEYLDEITALARATPHVNVIPRSIPDDELQVYLNAADCVVLPYREILTSGTALLALSFGRPVVAPNLGSMADHVDAASGILYDAAEPQGLALAMQEVRHRDFDPLATLSQARQFTWSAMADTLLSTA
jgi:beta-1,4-mannosyltransferase